MVPRDWAGTGSKGEGQGRQAAQASGNPKNGSAIQGQQARALTPGLINGDDGRQILPTPA